MGTEKVSRLRLCQWSHGAPVSARDRDVSRVPCVPGSRMHLYIDGRCSACRTPEPGTRWSERVTLWWSSADRRGQMDHGHYPSVEAAVDDVPGVHQESLAQCVDDEQRVSIESGHYEVVHRCRVVLTVRP